MKRIVLKKGREKPLLKKHPWVFSGSVRDVDGEPAPGDTVAVCAADGGFLAWAAYSPESMIAARVWTFDREEEVGGEFFRRRIRAAFERRLRLGFGSKGDEAFRIVYSEADGLPGFIADVYCGVLVVQILAAGPERHRGVMMDGLRDAVPCVSIFERSDTESRGLEGLPVSEGLAWGKPVPEKLEIAEDGRRYYVDVTRGHKTGFYLDQRENRRKAAALAGGRAVLDCFCYTGGFTIAALSGGANRVTAVDGSARSLALLEQNAALNGFERHRCETVAADVFEGLRRFVSEGRKFGMVVLDPPKFSPAAENVERALRAYKDINMLAMKLLEPGGVLMTFSCSGAVGPDDFFRAVAWAALDSGSGVSVVGRLSQAQDHPVSLAFPQSEYLKGLLLAD